MARDVLTMEQVEEEIRQLQQSPMVKLAAREERVRNRRRKYLYWLRQQEKKGKQLAADGVTMESLDRLCCEQEIGAEAQEFFEE